jgi:predicted secreted acid phosphatase
MLFFRCWSAAAQQAAITVADEPANLDQVKQQLKKYQSCSLPTCYAPQLERQAEIAIGLLGQSVVAANPGGKLAIVLDIDETSLSNWAVETHDDFGFIESDLDWCIMLRCGEAIASTLRIFREAEKDKVAVFFISGRRESQREDTDANLRAEGYDHWEGLYLRPEDHPKDQTVSQYKSGERAKIIAKGHRIILNVGDQMSDLIGNPQGEHSVKLPNPFYFIP